MAPGVVSNAALIVLAESVVLVMTDSSELDSVWVSVTGRSGVSSCFEGSGDDSLAAAARFCRFWAKAALILRRIASIPPEVSRPRTLATRLWTSGGFVVAPALLLLFSDTVSRLFALEEPCSSRDREEWPCCGGPAAGGLVDFITGADRPRFVVCNLMVVDR
jgi:hypothetical protein